MYLTAASVTARTARARAVVPVLILSSALCAAAGATEPVPEAVGSPFAVALDSFDPDTGVFDANYDVQFIPATGDRHLAIWTRWADVDGSQNEVVGRLLDGADRPLGERFQVNAETPGWQQDAAVSTNGDRVLVAWRNHVGDDDTIRLRLLDDRGRPITPEEEVGDSGFPPAAALAPSGRGLVAWQAVSGGFRIYVQTVSSQGQLEGAPIPVTDFPPGSSKSHPAVGVDDAGRFLVAWRSWQQVGPGAAIFARWFDPSGTPLTSEFQVHQQVIPNQGRPEVAVAADGSALVLWDVCDFSDPSFPCEVRARAYAANGLPQGPEMRVSPPDGLFHESPAVALDASGNRAFSFESCHSDDGRNRYDCRLTTVFYAPDGRSLGEPFHVTIDGWPIDPSIAAVGDSFLVGWDVIQCDARGCGSEPGGAYAQRYRLVGAGEGPPAPPAGEPLASAEVPGFRFWVRIGGSGSGIPTRREADCLPETLCVSGAIPGRSELFLRIVGPKPNGRLWPTIVKFTTSEIEVWIEQESTGDLRYYHLDGASPGSSTLPGLFDRDGFEP